MAATTGQLGLVTPTQGTLSGTWGDTVNYGITEYVNIAIAGTLSFAGDGAITLANTTGNASASNIGATTAQYMVIRITGTQTVAKVITGPSYSKLYMVDHAGATSAVTFKASGQTGVSVAVGEKCFVYYNGTDYVKVASSVADGVTSVGGTGTVNGITLTGTVTSTGNLTLGGTLSGVNLASQVTGTLPIANGGTGTTSTTFANLTTNVTGTLPVANGGTGVTTSTGTGSTVLSASPTFTGVPLAPTAAVNTNTTQLATTAFVQTQIGASSGVTSFSAGTTGLTPSTGTTGAVTLAGTLAVANGGTGTATPSLVAGSNVVVTGTWPNQTISASGGGGGGTAGIYLAAAYGTLANGDKVVINTDGTVSAVPGFSQAANSATNFNGSTTNSSIGTYDSTNNKVVIAYTSSSNLYAIVGTISGTSISFGTAVTVATGVQDFPGITFDSVNGKVVIAYGDTGASQGYAVVGTVSGTSISFGTPAAFLTTFYPTSNITCVYDVVGGKIVISYTSFSGFTSKGAAIVGTVSGTSISFGTETLFDNTGNTFAPKMAYVGSSKVVIVYDNNGATAAAIVGTVSGTSISFGTQADFYSGFLGGPLGIAYDTTNTKVVVSYVTSGNVYYAIVGTVSGTSISFGTAILYFSSASTASSVGMSYSPYSNRTIISYQGASGYANFITGVVSGTTISFTPATVMNAASSTVRDVVYDPVTYKFVPNYSTTVGVAQIITVASSSYTNLTATNYIGISDAAYANGTIATIQTVGSIDDAQTGLTAGLAYYVQPNGTLASTAGSPSVFAGTAVSAVKLIIKG